jgi:hypothetical protein
MHPPAFAGQVRIARTMHPRGHPVRADGKRPPDGTRTPGHWHAIGARNTWESLANCTPRIPVTRLPPLTGPLPPTYSGFAPHLRGALARQVLRFS